MKPWTVSTALNVREKWHHRRIYTTRQYALIDCDIIHRHGGEHLDTSSAGSNGDKGN